MMPIFAMSGCRAATAIRFIFAAVAASPFMLADASLSVAQERVVWATGIDPATSHGIIAEKLGLFEKYGVKNIVVKRYPSSAVGIRSVLAGENDIGQGGDMNMVAPLSQGSKIRIIGSTRKKLDHYGAAIATAEITKPSDLSGKTVGLAKGSPVSHMFFDLWAAHNKVSNVEKIWLAPQEMLVAFSRGEIAALFVWSPWWQKALEVKPGAHVLTYDSTDNLLSADTVIAMTPKLEQHPETVKNILRAIKDADDYINNHRKETVELLSKELKLEPKLVSDILGSMTQKLAVDERLKFHMCQAYKFLLANKQVSQEPDWDSAIDDQYLRAVAPDRVTLRKPMRCD
jgi:NitT/TauT family transport system substrate-binding protein